MRRPGCVRLFVDANWDYQAIINLRIFVLPEQPILLHELSNLLKSNYCTTGACDFAQTELLLGVIDRDTPNLLKMENWVHGHDDQSGLLNGGGMDTHIRRAGYEEISKVDASASVMMSVNNPLRVGAWKTWGQKNKAGTSNDWLPEK